MNPTSPAHPRPPSDDAADEAARARFLEHVETCAGCRRAWLDDDPTRVFALLGELPPRAGSRDAPAWLEPFERVLDDVTRAVEGEVRATPWRRPRWAVAAAWAAGILLAVGLFRVPMGSMPRHDAIADATIESPPITNVEPETGTAVARRDGVAWVESAGEARVVDLSVGRTRVVMIFDPRMEL